MDPAGLSSSLLGRAIRAPTTSTVISLSTTSHGTETPTGAQVAGLAFWSHDLRHFLQSIETLDVSSQIAQSASIDDPSILKRSLRRPGQCLAEEAPNTPSSEELHRLASAKDSLVPTP